MHLSQAKNQTLKGLWSYWGGTRNHKQCLSYKLHILPTYKLHVKTPLISLLPSHGFPYTTYKCKLVLCSSGYSETHNIRVFFFVFCAWFAASFLRVMGVFVTAPKVQTESDTSMLPHFAQHSEKTVRVPFKIISFEVQFCCCCCAWKGHYSAMHGGV